MLQRPLTQLALSDALSINCAVNCTQLKAVPNVQQFLNVMNSWLIHALFDKAVN